MHIPEAKEGDVFIQEPNQRVWIGGAKGRRKLIGRQVRAGPLAKGALVELFTDRRADVDIVVSRNARDVFKVKNRGQGSPGRRELGAERETGQVPGGDDVVRLELLKVLDKRSHNRRGIAKRVVPSKERQVHPPQ